MERSFRAEDIPTMEDKDLLNALIESAGDSLVLTELLGRLEERDELQRIFDLQQSRVRVASKEWQKAHSQPNVTPDLGILIDWMWGQVKVCDHLIQGQLKPWQKLEDLYCPLCGEQLKKP